MFIQNVLSIWIFTSVRVNCLSSRIYFFFYLSVPLIINEWYLWSKIHKYRFGEACFVLSQYLQCVLYPLFLSRAIILSLGKNQINSIVEMRRLQFNINQTFIKKYFQASLMVYFGQQMQKRIILFDIELCWDLVLWNRHEMRILRHLNWWILVILW